MPAITLREVEAAYEFGCKVIDGSLSEADAVQRLVADYAMDRGSASGYIRQVGLFVTGKTYTRTINDTATRHYLTRIGLDFGPEKLAVALTALVAHIDYYEKVSGAKRPSLRKIYEEFSGNLPLTFEDASKQFRRDVEHSLRLPEFDRNRALPPAGHKPATKIVSSQIYVRNPHVVAAALIRSDGICENCMNPAPFLKKSDGKPFLEVHHKKTLAAGGDDTLDNVLALCPNCHRRHHFG